MKTKEEIIDILNGKCQKLQEMINILQEKNSKRLIQARKDHNEIVELKKEVLYLKEQNKNKRQKLKEK